ncbi:hypothetical protein ACOME3_002278 [Neoechinorhynchus agilis]
MNDLIPQTRVCKVNLHTEHPKHQQTVQKDSAFRPYKQNSKQSQNSHIIEIGTRDDQNNSSNDANAILKHFAFFVLICLLFIVTQNGVHVGKIVKIFSTSNERISLDKILNSTNELNLKAELENYIWKIHRLRFTVEFASALLTILIVISLCFCIKLFNLLRNVIRRSFNADNIQQLNFIVTNTLLIIIPANVIALSFISVVFD